MNPLFVAWTSPNNHRQLTRKIPRNCCKRYAHTMKYLAIILMSIILVGCPAVMRGVVKNQSKNPVVIYTSDNFSGGAFKVPTESKQELFWSLGCITVVEDENQYYFDGSLLPEEVVNVHMFSTSINLTYENRMLSYINKHGKTLALPEVQSCKSA